MQNSDNSGLNAIDLLEERVNQLLESFRDLKMENKEYRNQLKDSNSTQVILDHSKRKQLRKKIENLIEYLEDF